MTRAFTLIDSTLRDGSHALKHQFTIENVRRIVRALDHAGVPIIEVTHGDGLGGSSFNYGFSKVDEYELIRAAADEVQNAELAVLLIPGIGIARSLEAVRELGVSVARIATHCTEADISQQHIGRAKDLGMTVVGFLMMAHMSEPHDLLEQARMMESFGADVVYLTDSAGALTTDDVRHRIDVLRQGLDCQVGIHAHNNYQLAVANSVAAIQEGATFIDGCARGLGAGAGNTPTEVLVTVCERMGIETGVDIFTAMDVAEEEVAPIMLREQVVDRGGLLLGFAGVYSSFLLHASAAAERFGVRLQDLIIEIGKHGIVGGQEDIILDIAAELSLSPIEEVRA